MDIQTETSMYFMKTLDKKKYKKVKHYCDKILEISQQYVSSMRVSPYDLQMRTKLMHTRDHINKILKKNNKE